MNGPTAKAELDRIANEYFRRSRGLSKDFYAWSRRANLLFNTQAARACIELLHSAGLFPPDKHRILEVGCGGGTWLLEFLQWGADPSSLCGIDLVPDRIGRARKFLPFSDLRVGNAAELPWPDMQFDLVAQFTVFTSILDAPLKRAVAAEMLRVLKPRGAVLWFDFRINNPKNRAVRGIGAREIRSLFPGCSIQLQSVILAPPIARLVSRFSWIAAELLHALPFLRTHYAGLITKPGAMPK
jgi:ubiquinone/menaquinone biosynthesis C-methylase UbiE